MTALLVLLLVSWGIVGERGRHERADHSPESDFRALHQMEQDGARAANAGVQRTAGVLALWQGGQDFFDAESSEESQRALPIASILGMTIFIYFSIAFWFFMVTAGWVLFVKANEPGWASLVPFYNVWVMLRMLEKPWWWFIVFHIPIPIIQLVMVIIMCIELARYFGRSVLFGIGVALLPFIFVPIIAFGDDEYCAPDTA